MYSEERRRIGDNRQRAWFRWRCHSVSLTMERPLVGGPLCAIDRVSLLPLPFGTYSLLSHGGKAGQCWGHSTLLRSKSSGSYPSRTRPLLCSLILSERCLTCCERGDQGRMLGIPSPPKKEIDVSYSMEENPSLTLLSRRQVSPAIPAPPTTIIPSVDPSFHRPST